MSNLYFISDLHFGHANCLRFDSRPFETVEEQDKEIVRRWNQTVTEEDVVWILGDISWYSAEKTAEIIGKLNGTKNLCIGNHDEKLLKSNSVRSLFNEVCYYKELRYNDKGIVLSHYPMPCFKNHFYGWMHFYGHVHSGFEWDMMEHFRHEMTELYDKQCDMINVGCMMPYMNYVPKTADQIVNSYNAYKGK